MIEKRVCSYGYIPEQKMSQANTTPDSPLTYTRYEYERHEAKQNTKRHTRRRAAGTRKTTKCSDAESDTSDGFTVNSGGSGRSGDWGPLRTRQKAKYSRKHHENRASFTDSGISLVKTDSGDLSEISYGERFFVNHASDPYSDSSHERRCKVVNGDISRTQRSQSKLESSVNDERTTYLLKRSSSCSALPSNIKSIKENTSASNLVQTSSSVRPTTFINIEEKEKAILQQCFRNEGLSPECADVGCVYHGCQYDSISRFPLPDHMNYPLNKYYKSENNLNRLQPLKKIRTSLRKLKSRANSVHLSTPNRYETYSLAERDSVTPTIDNFNSNYFDSFQNLESEKIMTRLGKNPSCKKPWIKKLFKWGVGKSYVIKKKSSKKTDDNVTMHNGVQMRKRSNSTKSIPEAFINFLSKSQDKSSATTTATHEFEFMVPTTLQRANSMPSISLHQVQPAKKSDVDVIYFNETGLESDRISAQNLKRNIGQKNNHRCDIENNNRLPILHFKTSQKSFASCQNQIIQPDPTTNGHCQCCPHVQQQRFITQSNNYTPSVSDNEYRNDYGKSEKKILPIPYYTNAGAPAGFATASIVAPLDMKVSIERRAERRKICNMVFDTFV